MDQQDPSQGAVNAARRRRSTTSIWPPGPLSDALPSDHERWSARRPPASCSRHPLRPGQMALLGLTGIPPTQVPKGALQAVDTRGQRRSRSPAPSGATSSPGGGIPGKVEKGELGLPGVTVELQDSSGQLGHVDEDRRPRLVPLHGPVLGRRLPRVDRRPRPSPSRSAASAGSGSRLITPSVIIAYIWVWAGFAMVVIARRPRRDPARRAGGRAHRRRRPSGRSSAASPCRCSRPC